ncbi:molybdopterin-dependent oxidoreductase [Fundidesulfovibrio soli]|uniref:molybdopterin-dependent oxidoreductase n=1 Tax=Fundidesulfovibrio soli TaxID=2922716 RepID=UPI001FAFCCEF|nr:molybdopterin-dependent oxidoreductase [Fundidesulfovibrio soli]
MRATENTRSIVTTCTRDCPSCCGLLAVVEEGRLTAIKGNPAHPLNKGGCCGKMKAYVRRVYSPERVTSPMLRRGGAWRAIGWGEALDLWAEKIKAFVAESGPESILHYQGYGERTALTVLNERFFAHLGGVTGLAGTLCSGTAYAAMAQDFGVRVSHDPLDHLNARTIILWGRNPAVTQFNMTRILGEARKRGATVWLVDPAATESLALCSRHIQPRPGADVHLALGAARSALENGWVDQSFVSERATGFDAFRRIALEATVEERAALAGVSPADVRSLAQAMWLGKPTAILLGWGMHRHADAHLGVRAIDALSAMTGNVGLPGGGVSQGFEEYGPYDQSAWGHELHPPRRRLLMARIGREILGAKDPPIRMIVTSAANPVCMAPDSDTVAEAFSSREFTVHLGHFLDDTARLADLFLPCATFLEEDDVVAAYGHNFLGPVNKAVEPVGECRPQFDIYQDLAGRFPFAGEYVRPRDEWLRALCEPFIGKGFTLEQLRRGPLRDPDAPMAPWAEGPFATADGRFHFLGQAPSRSMPAPALPLWLLTIGSAEHLCSELTLAEHATLPTARIHPDTGAALGLAHGSPALLQNAQASVTVLVEFDAAQRRDVCLCARGGWLAAGHGLNRLAAARASALGSGTPYYETRVTLLPLPSGAAQGHPVDRESSRN